MYYEVKESDIFDFASKQDIRVRERGDEVIFALIVAEDQDEKTKARFP